jgi:hypothetical protein
MCLKTQDQNNLILLLRHPSSVEGVVKACREYSQIDFFALKNASFYKFQVYMVGHGPTLRLVTLIRAMSGHDSTSKE